MDRTYKREKEGKVRRKVKSPFVLFALLLVLGLTLAAAGCGGGSDDGGGGDEAAAEETAPADTAAPADTGAAAGGGEETTEGAAPSGDPILIGLATAQTGILAPYDLQASQLLQMRIDQINEAGGVLGRPITTEWIDTKSDQPLAATNAEELINNGAVVIVTTCDFDYSFPATQAAGGREVPGLSLCASSPKAATPDIVGPYGGSFGLGSDGEGVAGAEWWYENKPEARRAYIFKDDSLEYSKATADYFKARWEELGGEICGEDTFVGGPNLDLSSQVTRLRGAVEGCDFIYDGSWQPFGSQLIRAVRDAGIELPILTNASVNGTLVTEVAGNVSEVYAFGFACLPTYCEGTQTPEVQQIADEFQAEYGEPLGNHYALPGYALADAIAAAIETAGSTEGPAIAEALTSGGVSIEFFGSTMNWTDVCHRPQPPVFSVEQFTDGQNTQIDTQAVSSIPDIGDGNPCAGEQVAAG
jgi:branched-chain amino acid transport system substrate-binding protein